MRKPIGRIVNRAITKTCCWKMVSIGSAVPAVITLEDRLLSKHRTFMVKSAKLAEVLEQEKSEVFKESKKKQRYSSETGVPQ